MKPLWIALAILAVMVGLLELNAHHLKEITEPLAASVHEAAQAAKEEDLEKAKTLSTQAREEWEKHIDRLRLVQNHANVNEIALLLEEALAYLDCGDIGEYTAISTRAARAMEELGGMEEVSLGNLF